MYKIFELFSEDARKFAASLPWKEVDDVNTSPRAIVEGIMMCPLGACIYKDMRNALLDNPVAYAVPDDGDMVLEAFVDADRPVEDDKGNVLYDSADTFIDDFDSGALPIAELSDALGV